MPCNKDLIRSLQKNGRITTPKVAEAMDQIDRGIFVPEGESPYMDYPVPIGYNATISAPHMHAICLELLKDHLQPGNHVLDVGAGIIYFHSCNSCFDSFLALALSSLVTIQAYPLPVFCAFRCNMSVGTVLLQECDTL